MQKLSNFVEFINEAGRGRPRKVTVDSKPVEYFDADNVELTAAQQKKLDAKAQNVEKVKGKDEEHNGSHGLWAVEPPYDNDAVAPLDKKTMNKNLKRLSMKFDADEPFFILGKAGWGKTSIIKDLAKRNGRHIITVYLDKATATDLGGIPVPIQDGGVAKIVNAMPDWAAYMMTHKDKQFLLFFDEMNQAAPDVQNALMPIVLETIICNIKFDNFIVGAAGNFADENDAVSDLSAPLTSRFKPIIVWETGTEEAWHEAFEHLRKNKKWDEILPKKIVDKFEEYSMLFDNPRELEHKIFNFIKKLKDKNAFDGYDADDYYDRLEALAKTDLSNADTKKLQELAQSIFDYLNNVEENEENNSRSGRGKDMITDTDRDGILKGIKRGYMDPVIDGKVLKFGISKENIMAVMTDPDIFPESKINAEMAQRLLDKWEEDGIKFKFDTDKEWKDKGYLDPLN